MSVEVGVAYLPIVASTDQFAKDVKKAFGDVERESQPLTDSKSGIGAKLGKGFKIAAVSALALATAVTGIAVKKGLDRALQLDQVSAKLKGLGHDTQSIEAIMNSAMESVSGTAFGLGDASTVAASAVAAGIKPGKELTRTLKAVADASTIAGVDMSSMGAIFNKVAASNKVQMDVINQLHDAGVPALSLLAGQMGVTAEEASKMASAGKIDFETFQLAMEKGMGGAALESGSAAQGAWANMLAALGRVGEKLVSKVLPYAVKFFGKVQEWANAASPYVEKFASWLGDKIPAAIEVAKAILEEVTGGVRALIDAFKDGDGEITSSGFPGFMERVGYIARVVFDEIKGGIQAFIEAFKAADGDITSSGFAGFMEGLGYAVRVAFDYIKNTALPALQDFAKWVGREILPKIAALAGWLLSKLGPALKNTVNWVIKNKDRLAALAVVIGAVVAIWLTYTAATKAWTVITNAAKAAQLAFNAVMAMNPIGLVVTAIAALVAGLVYFFTQTDTGKRVWEAFTSWLVTAWEWVKSTGEAIWNGLADFFTGLWDGIKSVFTTVWDFIKGLFAWTPLGIIVTNWDSIRQFFVGMWDKIKGFFTAAWDFIKQIISFHPLAIIVNNWDSILQWFKDLPGKIAGFVSGLWDKVKTHFSTAKDNAQALWDGLLQWFKDLPGNIANAFSNIWQKISSPFKTAFNKVAEFWNSTVGQLKWTVPDWVPKIGGKTVGAPTLPMLATGGTAMASGWSIIGEQGPELLHMPRGASVVPLDHPASAMADGGNGSAQSVGFGEGEIERLVRAIIAGLAKRGELVSRDAMMLGV